jgi:hypothetical protein
MMPPEERMMPHEEPIYEKPPAEEHREEYIEPTPEPAPEEDNIFRIFKRIFGQ